MNPKPNRKMKICKATALCLALLLTLALVPACAQAGPGEEELRGYLDRLLPAAEALNEIYYGTGLPTKTGEPGAVYLVLADDAAYKTAGELQAATLAVFSEAMAGQMYAVGVQGIYDEEDESFDLSSRYTEILGMFVMRAAAAAPVLSLGRTYDLSTVKALRSRPNYAEVSVMSEKDGEQLEVTLRLVPATDATDAPLAPWLLDSPTY